MFDSKEVGILMAVCKTYGYGNVIQMASTLWRMDAEKKGYPDAGCFVPICLADLDTDRRKMIDQSHEIYKYWVEKYL